MNITKTEHKDFEGYNPPDTYFFTFPYWVLSLNLCWTFQVVTHHTRLPQGQSTRRFFGVQALPSINLKKDLNTTSTGLLFLLGKYLLQ